MSKVDIALVAVLLVIALISVAVIANQVNATFQLIEAIATSVAE